MSLSWQIDMERQVARLQQIVVWLMFWNLLIAAVICGLVVMN